MQKQYSQLWQSSWNWLSVHFHFSLSCIGEGNGNPLQCSCLENPREGGAWWAAIYGVAQSRTRWSDLAAAVAAVWEVIFLKGSFVNWWFSDSVSVSITRVIVEIQITGPFHSFQFCVGYRRGGICIFITFPGYTMLPFENHIPYLYDITLNQKK